MAKKVALIICRGPGIIAAIKPTAKAPGTVWREKCQRKEWDKIGCSRLRAECSCKDSRVGNHFLNREVVLYFFLPLHSVMWLSLRRFVGWHNREILCFIKRMIYENFQRLKFPSVSSSNIFKQTNCCCGSDIQGLNCTWH